MRELTTVRPRLERGAKPQTIAEVKHDRRVRSGRLELVDDRFEAGDDAEFPDQPISLVPTNLNDVRRNPDPNCIGPIRFHRQQTLPRAGACRLSVCM